MMERKYNGQKEEDKQKQSMVGKTVHSKQTKNRKTRTSLKTGVNSCAPEG
jgi:hypothetical protein